MKPRLVTIPGPKGPIYRCGRGRDPFDPPGWQYAGSDGTFGMRHDDPRAKLGVPETQRYRICYVCEQPDGAIGECIARFRPSIGVIAKITEFSVDPIETWMRGGFVPSSFRSNRRIGSAYIETRLPFVDLQATDTILALREIPMIAQVAANIGVDVDYSTVNGSDRRISQTVMRFIAEQTDSDGNPLYAGAHYASRLAQEWSCWSIIHGRVLFTKDMPATLFPDNPAFLSAASRLGINIEVFPGHYIYTREDYETSHKL